MNISEKENLQLMDCALAHLKEAVREVVETMKEGDRMSFDILENLKEALERDKLNELSRLLRAEGEENE